MTRPARVLLVAGTATEIGKTWVGGQTIAALRRLDPALRIAARKPAQSFDPADPHPTDAQVLAAASGEPEDVVSPPHRSYTVAMAPPMAADSLGQPPFTVADLLAELHWPEPEPADIGWIETVGGPRSPIADDGDTVTLAALLDPDEIVLVADAGLGTVNAVLVSLAPLAHWPATVILNHYDEANELHRRNRDWLVTREGLEVVTNPEALARKLLDR